MFLKKKRSKRVSSSSSSASSAQTGVPFHAWCLTFPSFQCFFIFVRTDSFSVNCGRVNGLKSGGVSSMIDPLTN